MKTNREELKRKVDVCVDYLQDALSKGFNEIGYAEGRKDFSSLSQIIEQMSNNLAEFNFYPSGKDLHCCEVSFFMSLDGKRWNLKNSEKISFDLMYKHIIKHCQGSCPGITTYIVLLVDHWDVDIAKYWEPNIERLKLNGVTIDVRMLI
jgi:hypothetical protein